MLGARARLWASAVVACRASASRVQQRLAPPTRLIIDTDMSTDVDDVVALAVAHRLVDLGEAELLGVVHNTGLVEGVGAVSVLNHYYGRDGVPLGAYKGRFGNPEVDPDPWVRKHAAGPYVRELLRRFPSPVRNSSEVPDAVSVYRSLLAREEERSVVIASIGFLSNLADLLASGPDEHSPMPGRALVEHAVRELVVMGGCYPASGAGKYEWNFGGGCEYGSTSCPWTPRWTEQVVTSWPSSVPLTFSGAEVGEQVLIGSRIEACMPEASPVRTAMLLYKQPPLKSWDPITILYAVRGLGRWFRRSTGGINAVSAADGSNRWIAAPDGSQSYLELVDGGAAHGLAEEIDDLLCAAERRGEDLAF